MSAIIGDNLGQRLCTFHRCRLNILNQDGNMEAKHQGELTVEVFDTFKKEYIINIREGNCQVTSFGVDSQTETCRMGRQMFLIAISRCSYLLQFSQNRDLEEFARVIRNLTGGSQNSLSTFNERTEESSALQYFQFYGYLSQQQNMMQDYIRTSTYQRAMIQNIADFKDKVVLDVGAGSGILSFFAVQAGARKVYAVEASSMAIHAEVLIKSNKLSDKIKVVTGKIEEVEIPEQVDIIISEPMGYMLFNERMLESYLHAKKFLKPQGKMFPTRGNLYCAPFMDDALYMDHFSKSNFWNQNSFYGVDVSSLRHSAAEEYFKQPIVDTFDVRILMAKPVTYTVDFNTAHEEDLHKIHIPLNFLALQSGTIHGLAFWFDVAFFGSTTTVWLSTAPHEPLTHWYQVRCLLQQPLLMKAGHTVTGYVSMISNKRQSYDVEMEVCIEDTGMKSRNVLDLKNPFFCYTGTQPAQPPGTHSSSPTEAYWANINAGLTSNAINTVWNTGAINGTVIGGNTQGNMNVGQSIGNIPGSVTISTSNPMVLTSGNSQYPINRYMLSNQTSFATVSSAGDFVPGHILMPQQHYPYSGYSTSK